MTEQPPPLNSPESEPSSICSACQLETSEPGYSTPLCVTCRDRLARRPFPLLIKVSGLLILIALVFAIKRFDQSVRAGISYTRGQRAEQRHNYAQAVHHYQEVAAVFPDSRRVLIRLANAHCELGQVDEAAASLRQLSGQTIPRDLASDYERARRQVTYELRLRQAGYNNVRSR